MEQSLVGYEEVVSMNGQIYRINIYHDGGAKYFAMTRFSENDAFICDGISAEEALTKHRVAIPLAINCRPSLSEKGLCHALTV